MKVLLIRPVKTGKGWVKDGTVIDLPKAEAERLAKKGACVSPLDARDIDAEGKAAE